MTHLQSEAGGRELWLLASEWSPQAWSHAVRAAIATGSYVMGWDKVGLSAASESSACVLWEVTRGT